MSAPPSVPDAPPPHRKEDSLLERLLDAYRAADEAEARLERARRLYAATHTGPALDALRDASQRALRREIEFEEAWREAQRELTEER